jgi:hypothetical protein
MVHIIDHIVWKFSGMQCCINHPCRQTRMQYHEINVQCHRKLSSYMIILENSMLDSGLEPVVESIVATSGCIYKKISCLTVIVVLIVQQKIKHVN